VETWRTRKAAGRPGPGAETASDTPHAYGCECSRCRGMAAAIAAKDSSGEYFFTDEELLEIARANP
jgi:hypothetical protein